MTNADAGRLDPIAKVDRALHAFSDGELTPIAGASSYSLKEPFLVRREQHRIRRRNLVDALRSEFPFALLWLNNLNAELSKTLGKPIAETGTAGLWQIPPAATADRLLGQLALGGWGMLFLRVEPTAVLVPDVLVTRPSELDALLTALDAHAAIVSWYDDQEWIVTFSREDVAPS